MMKQTRNSKSNLFLIKACNKLFRMFLLNAVGENSLSELGRFERDGWDEILFRNLKLNSDSRILILCGYKGESTSEYRRRFDSNVIALEPVQEYYEILIDRFENDRKVIIHNLALAAKSGRMQISINSDSTGFFEKTEDAVLETINCVGVQEFFTPAIGSLDLVEINIEGAEYEVLESIIQLNLQFKITSLLIQFHRNAPDFELKRRKIREILKNSHNEVFCYEFVWERWDLKLSN